MGIPMGLQYSITAIGAMMVQSSLNILGSFAVAAFTAGTKIENIFTPAFVAIGTTISTYNHRISEPASWTVYVRDSGPQI